MFSNRPDYRPGGGRGPGDDLKGGFATTAAAMIAMLASPALNEVTVPYVIWLAERSYPRDVVELIRIAWMIACFPFVYYAAKAGIGAALTVAGVYLAYRFI
jgi:hypothetical protein